MDALPAPACNCAADAKADSQSSVYDEIAFFCIELECEAAFLPHHWDDDSHLTKVRDGKSADFPRNNPTEQREKRQQNFVQLKAKLTKLRSQRPSALAGEIDALIERAIGLCARRQRETYGIAKSLADDIRDATSRLRAQESTALVPAASQAAEQNTADTKTDKPKKLPQNPEITKAAKHVVQQREKAQRDGTPEPSLIDSLTEFTHGDPTKALSLRRALQPSRYGWLLNLGADK
jgi:hypothetical protein